MSTIVDVATGGMSTGGRCWEPWTGVAPPVRVRGWARSEMVFRDDDPTDEPDAAWGIEDSDAGC